MRRDGRKLRARPLELTMRREDPGPVNVPPSSDLAGQRPWWPLVEPTPRWIRVRIDDELVADSRRALLHVQYGPGALPRSFLPTYYVPVDDVMPAALVDPMEAETGLTVWAVAAAGLRATTLPVRYYLPPDDVRIELVPSQTRSVCPYKGVATWWSARIGDRVAEDIAWSYPSPIPENPRIAGLICFRNEWVDLTVDGQRLERPITPWS
jgi:uncharacterized protein (DUF427 family)